MNPTLRTFARYALAVGAVAAGYGLYRGLSAWVGSDLPTFITLYPVVAAVALIGGLGPGLFATALAALVADCWIQEPRGELAVKSLHDGVALSLFCCMGAFISTVIHLYQRARGKAAAYDQEQALRDIRREKEFLASLLEHASQPFAVSYPDGRVGRFNRAYEQLTGYAAAELRTLDWSAKLTPPEWREIERQKLEELNRTGQPVRYEKEYVRKDGSRVPIELLVHLARGAEGQPEYYYAFLTDITERKQAEETLRSKEATLRGILNAAKESIWLFSPDGLMLAGNAMAFTRFEKPPGEMIGRHFTEILPAELARTRLARLREVVESASPIEFEDERGGMSFRHSFYPVLDSVGRVASIACFSRDITERRRAEQERARLLAQMQQQNAELEAVLAAIQDAVVIYDQDMKVRRVNQAFVPTCGFDPIGLSVRDIIQRTCCRWLDGRPFRLEEQPTPRALQGDTVRNQRFLINRADGAEIALETSSSPLRLGDRVVGSVTVWHDITERRRAEEKLRESEALYRAIGESIAYGVWACDASGRNTYASESFLKLVGLTQAQCSDFGWGDVLHPEDAERTIAAWKECSRTGGTWDIEHRFRGVDGQYHAVLARGVPVRNQRGEIVCWAGINLDISRLKQAEEALRRARDELELRVQERTAKLQQTNEQLRREIEVRRQTEQRLTEAELRYRTVADFTYDWEYWKTPEGLLLYCSPSCERITGYTTAELVVSPELLVQMIHPQDRDNWQQHDCEAMAEPRRRSITFQIHRKDGGMRWIEHFCQPITGSQGQFLGVRASNRDITDRKEEELQSQQLRDELAHVTRVITAGQLAASLAHELNQPLTAILCNAQTAGQLLASDPPNVPEVREVLDDIAHDSERAGGVIHRLRALFNKTGQDRSVLQLNDIIQETLDLLRSEFVLKGIATQVHLEPTLPTVLGNRIELQQVVLNLVVNALDAMSEREPGQRHLQIRTGCEGPKQIRASVRDSGTGIRVQPISRLFEPFFTTKANGMGMGLAISQSILEAHDGRLGAVNNPDRGATFQLTLPIHHGEHA